jgi:hypothetical protein
MLRLRVRAFDFSEVRQTLARLSRLERRLLTSPAAPALTAKTIAHTTQYVRRVPHRSRPPCLHKFPSAQFESQRYSDNASSSATNTKAEHTTFPGAKLSYRRSAHSLAPLHASRSAKPLVMTKPKRGLRRKHMLRRPQKSTLRRRSLVWML